MTVFVTFFSIFHWFWRCSTHCLVRWSPPHPGAARGALWSCCSCDRGTQQLWLPVGNPWKFPIEIWDFKRNIIYQCWILIVISWNMLKLKRRFCCHDESLLPALFGRERRVVKERNGCLLSSDDGIWVPSQTWSCVAWDSCAGSRLPLLFQQAAGTRPCISLRCVFAHCRGGLHSIGGALRRWSLFRRSWMSNSVEAHGLFRCADWYALALKDPHFQDGCFGGTWSIRIASPLSYDSFASIHGCYDVRHRLPS